MSKRARTALSRCARAVAAAALALPLLAAVPASDAAAQTNRYGNAPGEGWRDDPGWRRDVDPRWRREPGIVLYSRGGFGGRNVALDGDMPDLRQIGFNDRTSSLRVNWGVWEVCRDVNYGGRCARIDRSVGNFGRMTDQISSVRLIEGRRADRRHR